LHDRTDENAEVVGPLRSPLLPAGLKARTTLGKSTRRAWRPALQSV